VERCIQLSSTAIAAIILLFPAKQQVAHRLQVVFIRLFSKASIWLASLNDGRDLVLVLGNMQVNVVAAGFVRVYMKIL